jgi:CRISPR-associated endonuclease/helicase Cas3
MSFSEVNMALYPYQERVKALLLSGKSVILQAPTGSGKTRSALAPYIEAFFDQPPEAFPRKCIYSVPMRVLANQFFAEYTELTASYYRRTHQEMRTGIQTGEHAQDPRFRGDLIFTTIDQSLSSALGVPYSQSTGMANLNAGAFYSSYLVFDEFHLFPLSDETGAQGALTTTLQLLMQMKNIVPFVLMTATFSSTMLNELAALLDAEIVQVSREEYAEIAAGQAERMRSRRYFVHGMPLAVQPILVNHQKRTLVICNQVKRAQELCDELRQVLKGSNTRVELLHSRFLPMDRQRKEQFIRREFGKDRSQYEVDSLIVVATQVIEVGLDITCERLHTEIAPANAIFQRAGRCARYPGEQGEVHLYAVPQRERSDGITYPDFLPYPKTVCESTWQSFTTRHEQTLDFVDEQQIIDEVHTESDRQLLAAMQRQSSMLWTDIFAAMQEGAREQRANLIRRVDNINVLAAESPAAIGNPFRAQSFGLYRGTVKGLLKTLAEYAQDWQPTDDINPWLMQFPIANTPNPDDPTEPVTFAWHEVTDESLLDGTAIVAINSAFCAYDDDVGFRIVPPTEGGWVPDSSEDKPRNSQDGYSYQRESYADHIRTMLMVYRRDFAAGYGYLARQLTARWNLPPKGLDRAIQAAIAFHDLAKMDIRWQRWVRLYQQAIDDPIADKNYMAVHTHWSPAFPHHRDAKRLADRQCKRPPHAGESAVAGARLIAEVCARHDGLTRAVITAITRHHSAQAQSFQPYELHPAATQALTEALAFSDLGALQSTLLTQAPAIRLEDILVEGKNFEGLLLYFLIVRVLRLCDGLSQEE